MSSAAMPMPSPGRGGSSPIRSRRRSTSAYARNAQFFAGLSRRLVRTHVALELLFVPARQLCLGNRLTALAQLGEPVALLAVDVHGDGSPQVLQLVEVVVGHRLQLVEPRSLHLCSALLLYASAERALWSRSAM